ncbi:hypothetical protein EJB05_54798, partial [Eragrostis curvula]
MPCSLRPIQAFDEMLQRFRRRRWSLCCLSPGLGMVRLKGGGPKLVFASALFSPEASAQAGLPRQEEQKCPIVFPFADMQAVFTEDRREQSGEARKEELYHALSAQRTLVWQVYFYVIAMFTALLIYRHFSHPVVLSMTAEMSIAFTMMTLVYYNIVLLNSPWVTPLWVSGLYQWAGGMGMWFFTACWMVMYTINIPPALFLPRQLIITLFFVLVTLAISVLSKVPQCASFKTTAGVRQLRGPDALLSRRPPVLHLPRALCPTVIITMSDDMAS